MCLSASPSSNSTRIDIVDSQLVDFGDSSIDTSKQELLLDLGYDKYTLEDLAKDAGVREDFSGLEAHGVSEEIVRKYLDDDDSYELQSDKEVSEWNQDLPDFVIKGPQQPDVCVRSRDNKGVVLVVEAHSGSGASHFYKTVKKTTYAIMSQLRFLRQQYDIDRVVGFTFPNQQFAAVVVKVTVFLKIAAREFGFFCELNALQLKQVGQEVRGAAHEVKQLLVQSSTELGKGYPFRLTQDNLRMINHILASGKWRQHADTFRP